MKVGFNNNLSSTGAFQQKKSETFDPSAFKGLKDNNFQDKPLNASPSFTGINYSKVTSFVSGLPHAIQKGYDSLFIKQIGVVPDLPRLIKDTNAAIGDDFLSGRLTEFQKLYGQRSSSFIEVVRTRNGEHAIIKDRTFAGKIIHGLAETAKLPLDMLCAVSNFLSSNPVTKNMQSVLDLSNSKLVTGRKNEKAGEELFYRLKGIMEYDDVFLLQKDIFKVPEGKPVGNYAPKSERALNRLITGFVSSMFVGKDFFNLTMYNTNDKDKADEAGKRRFKREMSRIALNAFLTYAVLGAFSNFASRSKAVACALIAGTSLASEIITRLAYGIPLTPLSAEGAKKYNKKHAAKMGKGPNITNIPHSPQISSNAVPTPIYLTSNAPKVFEPFTKMRSGYSQSAPAGMAFAGYQQPEPVLQNQPAQAQPQEKRKHKKIMNTRNVALTVLAFNLIYGVARSRSTAFNNLVETIKKRSADVCKQIAKSKLVVRKDELSQFLSGFDGQGLERIKRRYSYLISDLRFTDEERAILMQGTTKGRISINPADQSSDKTRVFFKALRDAAIRSVDEEILEKSKSNMNFNADEARWQALAEINELFGRHAIKNGKPITHINLNGIAHDVSTNDFDKIVSNLNVERINFNIKKDGSEFVTCNAEYDFGRIANTPFKGLVDAACELKRAVSSLLFLPLNLLDMIIGKSKQEDMASQAMAQIERNRRIYPDLGELYKDCSAMYTKFRNNKISKQEFSEYLANANTKFLNKDTTPSYPQTALASVSRNLVTIIASYFFINDFRNEVLIQSNGEDTEKAKEVMHEKLMHKLCNYVFNKCFMEFFNHTFEPAYLGSLSGATAVAAVTEMTNESAIRSSIGIPLKKMPSKESIDEYEKKHLEAKGFKGWYFRTIAKVTGKKRLSQKAEGDKK